MAFPQTANITSLRVRRQENTGARMKRYQVDPHWGIPAGQPPLFQDPTTGLVRPFSSAVTRATATANFVGFCNEWVPPGEDRSVWVSEVGWAEFKLATPLAVHAGDKFKPVTVTGSPNFTSNETLEAASGGEDADAIFTAIEDCACQPSYERATSIAAVPVAADTSPTTPTRSTLRTVTVYFEANR